MHYKFAVHFLLKFTLIPVLYYGIRLLFHFCDANITTDLLLAIARKVARNQVIDVVYDWKIPLSNLKYFPLQLSF